LIKRTLATATLLALTLPTFGASLECDKLNDCLQKYENLSQKKYVTAKPLKGDNINFKIKGSLEKIDHAFSFLLNQHGYTRVRQPKDNPSIIISTRDIRYNPTPLIDSKDLGSIPHNYDYFMVNHTLKNKFLGKDITRALRPFMSRYGRIIVNEKSGMITLQDTGLNIHRLLKLINEYDIQLSEEEVMAIKKEQRATRKHHRRLEVLKAKHGDHRRN
jgi:type II secretory pathway component GspD/PulD (secretin)